MRRAFSLMEIAVLLVIFGGIAGMSVVLGSQWIDKQEVDTSRSLMGTIEQGLDTYRKINGRLPCPGDLTLTPGDAGYGYEAYEAGDTLGTCHGEAGINATDATGGVSVGSVPAKTLGMADSLMRDQWGNLIVYYVTDVATADGAFWDSPKGPNYIEMDDPAGEITIQDATGADRTVDAIYALVSHGANGHGGYHSGGARVDGGDATAHEEENCDCDDAAAGTGADNVLVARLLEETHDDLVTFKERRHLYNKVVLNATACSAPGDVCADGTVYVDGVIYAAAADESGTYEWKTAATDTPGTGSATDGSANTAAMIAAGAAAHPAAQACDTLNVHGYGDWFLPAADELDQLYQNEAAIGGFDTGGAYYWSSTQDAASNADRQRFSDGTQDVSLKTGSHAVRCVRKP